MFIQNIKRSVFYFLLLFTIASCSKPDSEYIPPNPVPAPDPVARPVGAPIGEAHVGFIGEDGGTIKFPNGQVEIIIPAGALDEETEVSIQAIKNSSVSGIGFGYRFTPHGKIFKKKVTVRFSYKNMSAAISSSKALEIAYQDGSGFWVCHGKTVNDPVNKTISVETDHFSDWSLIESMELTPAVKILGLGESVTFKAVRYVHPIDEEDFVTPLTIPDAKTGEAIPLSQSYIRKWTLNGPGSIEVKGNEAIYKAPSAKPSTSTATVTVELNVKGTQVLMISTIHLIDEGISVSIDGGEWQTYMGMANKDEINNLYSFASLRITEDIPQITFMWPVNSSKSDGTYGWSMLGSESDNVIFQYATPDLKKIYASVFDEEGNNNAVDSGGFLNVEEVNQQGKKYLTGMFVVEPSGMFSTETGEQLSVHSIVGTFKVQRSW